MNKKNILILAVVIVLLGLGIFLLLKLQSSPSTSNSGSGNNSGFNIKPAPPLPKIQVPSGDQTTVPTKYGDIQVKNFYKTAAFTVSPSVYLVDNKFYSIIYSESTEDFLIDLYAHTKQEAAQYRASAESEYMSALGVSKQDACKIPIVVEVPYSYNQDLASKNYGLSFCPGATNF